MENTPNLSAETRNLPDPSAPAGPKRKKRKIVRKIILILLALAFLALLGGYTYWVIKGSKLDLPYGLKGGMTLGELRRAMTDSGFVEERVESQSGERREREVDGETKEYYSQASDTVYYVPVGLYGVMPDEIALKKREKTIDLSYTFDSARYGLRTRKETVTKDNVVYDYSYCPVASGELVTVYSNNPFKYCYSGITAPDGTVYNKDNPTPDFRHILSELTNQYGSPSKHLVGSHPRYEWTGIKMNFDEYIISIYFYNDTGYVVSYQWSKSGIF